MSTAIVIGLGSDIGRELARRLAADGWNVKGTHHRSAPGEFESTPCDLVAVESVAAAGRWLAERCQGWRALVVAAGTEEPVGPFWDCDEEDWDRGVRINTLSPLRLVRALYPLRDRAVGPSVAFFSGSGTNNAAPAYSAYAASKLMLIKMCELLDAESEDTSFFIIGPGIVRTKIHEETLRAQERASANHRRVVEFLRSADPGTSHDDVYACLRWCIDSGKAVVGGRNISLAHDAWRDGGGALKQWLAGDPSRYKLRRFGNEHRIERTGR
jgi:NAD(P)-dependent dehydrogenase (short-subunit alcohol dehydrogenase family)